MYLCPLSNICVWLVILVVDTGCVECSFPLGAIRPFLVRFHSEFERSRLSLPLLDLIVGVGSPSDGRTEPDKGSHISFL